MLSSSNNGLLNKSRHTHNVVRLFVHWNLLSGRTSYLRADNRSLHRLGYCVGFHTAQEVAFLNILVIQGMIESKCYTR